MIPEGGFNRYHRNIPLDADHVGISKFKSPKDPNYLRFVREFAEELKRIKPQAVVTLQRDEIPYTKDSSRRDFTQLRSSYTQSRPPYFTFDVPFQLDFVERGTFTGRQDVLQDIHRRMNDSSNTFKQHRVYLTGMPGIGKTQIAIRYARSHSQEYSSIFWINAQDEKTVCQGFTRIAERLLSLMRHYFKLPAERIAYLNLIKYVKIVDDETVIENPSCDLAKAIQQWFVKEGNQNWLLIFDNYDRPDEFDLQNYIPKSSWGNILITTRVKELAANPDGMVVPELDLQNAITLLQSRIGLGRIWDNVGKLEFTKTKFVFSLFVLKKFNLALRSLAS
jgi:hypothetical protein